MSVSHFKKWDGARKFAPVVAILVVACVALAACGAPKAATQKTTSGDEFNKMKIATATADSSAKAVVYSDSWAAVYPDQYNSLQLNANDSEAISYLEESPYLSAIYAGTPFSKDYKKARGHSYTITDVQATERIGEKTKATCYACKGSYYPSNESQGTTLFKKSFKDATAEGTADGSLVSIGCYDCHLNNPGTALASRDFFNEAFPTAAKDWGSSAAACGQCHNEYYFDGTTGAVAIPEGITDFSKMLEYYNGISFVDYTNPNNGTKQLKAQHPEVQMFDGSVHQKAGLTCADCHMEKLVDANGVAYTSHEIVNPTESEVIQTTVCQKCHASGSTQVDAVKSLQTKTKAKEDELGNKLKALDDAITAAQNSGKYTDDELNAIRDANRTAMWYWDCEYVENSDGFHNSAKATDCFTKCSAAIDQANALMNK